MADFIKETDSLNEGRKKLNAIAEEMDKKDVSSAPEIVAARGNHKSLSDAIKTKINKNQGEVTPADLSQEVKEQLTGGSVAVVGINAVGNENVKQKAIDDTKLADSEILGNLFNKDNAIPNSYIDNQGNWKAGSPNEREYYASGFIPVLPNTEYTRTARGYYGWYDSERKYISGGSTVDEEFTSPGNAYFFRAAIEVPYFDDYQFKEKGTGNTYPDYKYKLRNLKIDRENMAINSVSVEETDFIVEKTGKNLFDKSKTIPDSAPWWSHGGIEPFPDYHASDFIRVEPGKIYTRTAKHAVAFYNEFKQYTTGYSNGDTENNATNSFVVPEGSYYVRLSIPVAFVESFQLEEGNTQTSYEPYKMKMGFTFPVEVEVAEDSYLNPWKGKTVIFTGDSITDPAYGSYNERYPLITAQELEMNIKNYAITSSTIAINPNNTTARTPIISRYEEMDDQADLVIVAAGTNDWRYDWSPLGDNESRDNETFYGAVHNLCLGLKKKYPGKQLLFLTPIMRKQGSYTEPNSKNNNEKTLKEYGEIIKEICNGYSIPVLDMYSESGLYPFDDELADQFMPDRTHPNGEGQKLMAKRLIGYLRQLA